MSSLLHGNQTAGEIHQVHNWEYADAAARAAATGFVTADLKKVAYQASDSSFWILTATTPTWVRVGAEAGYTPGGGDVAVTDGGTGASTASAARTNLGLEIGADVEEYLGNPATDGHVLSSTIAGVRSWVEMTGGVGVAGIGVDEDDVSEGSGITSLNFSTGLNVSVSGTEATITADGDGGGTPPARTSIPTNTGFTSEAAGYYLWENRVYFAGEIVVTSTTIPITLITLPVGYRPASTKYILIPAFNGTSVSVSTLRIGTDGVVTYQFGLATVSGNAPRVWLESAHFRIA